MTIHLLNTSILPSGGAVRALRVPTDARTAASLLAHYPSVSHIGHESTAAILSALVGRTVPMDRTPLMLTEGEATVCVVFQLRGRAPEGVILSAAEVEAIGYDLYLLIMEPVAGIRWSSGSYLGVFARLPDVDRYAGGAAVDEVRDGVLGLLPETGDTLHVTARGNDDGYGATEIAIPVTDLHRLVRL